MMKNGFDEQIKYVFKKAYVTNDGSIPEGTEIILLRGNVFINGGMADPYSRHLLLDIIRDKAKCGEYLMRMKIIGNKV